MYKQVIIACFGDFGHVSISGLIQVIQESGFSQSLGRIGNRAKEELIRIVAELEQDPKRKAAALAHTPFDALESPVAYLRRELLRNLVRAKGTKINSNDGIDFYHAVNAVAACKYVLLDGQWSSWIKDLKARILDAGRTDPFARVYSKRRRELETFFADLEADI